MPVSTRQARYLRGLSHQLNAVVTVADKGLTANVLTELESALTKHELIKVKLRADRDMRKDWIAAIESQCKAQCVHVIGQMACFYKRNDKKPVISLSGMD